MKKNFYKKDQIVKILFVCLGNICRSAAAEAVMCDILHRNNCSSVIVDSAGTINFHEGKKADSRMIRAAKKRAINITSISRQIKKEDFYTFDYIFAMDRLNYTDINAVQPEDATAQIFEFIENVTSYNINGVPDPYYGGDDGFEEVLDILTEGCMNLYKKLEKEIDKKV